MLQTIVERAPADRRGDDITDILLTTMDAQISRGRAEINATCSNRRKVDCNLVAAGFVAPTATVQVTDIELGPVYGVVDSFSLSFSVSGSDLDISASMTYEMEEG